MKGDASTIDKIAKQIKKDIKDGWNYSCYSDNEERGDTPNQRLMHYSITLVKEQECG